MNKTFETAVIPVAGAGTRMFPGTTAIEKCMLPVYEGDLVRPLVDYMVEDCVGAGVKRVLFVTSERGRDQLSDYFGPDLPWNLRGQLERLGKQDKIDAEHDRRNHGMTFEYLIQPAGAYGTTIPLYTAQAALKGEQNFALMGGDDFVYHPDGTSELGLAKAAWHASSADNYVMGLPVARTEAPKYGILQTDAAGNLLEIDEKPPLERVSENPIANISRYILSDRIWQQVEAEMSTERAGEHYITYPIGEAIQAGQTFGVHGVTGKYLDGGSPHGMREAIHYLADNPRVNC